MIFSQLLNKKAEKQQSMLNVEEAYNLWDVTTAKYYAIDQMNVWATFVHDYDLKLLLKKRLHTLNKHLNSLERELKKYSINGPKRPVKGINTRVNSELMLDENLANNMLIWLQENIEMLFRAIRTSTTNDSIRALFTKFFTEAVDALDFLIKYMKLKGWVEIPPMYPNIPTGTIEKLDTGEAFHLWDHLTFRYDNIYQTQFWYEYANDIDFKFLLKTGLQSVLQEQAEMLEKEILKFGISLPKRPPAVIAGSYNTTLLEDSHMFRILFTGIVGAAWIHALALKQSVTNDRIRGIFKDLLVREIGFLDKLILFGKLKGWLAVVPKYKPLL